MGKIEHGAWRVRGLVLGLAAILQCAAPAFGQDTQAADQKAAARAALQAREAYRERLNENVLFLMGGGLGAAYIAIAHDISVVVEAGLDLRVLPVVGGAGVQNVHDVVFLRGIDLALTNVQTLDLLKKTGELGPNLDRQVSYIAPLFPEEMQVLVRGNIRTIEDLRGKKVNVNNKGSATALLVPAVFKDIGVDIEVVNMGQPDAIQKMRNGEIEATVCMCPKPVPAYASARPEWGFKLIDVPFAPALQGKYLPASISHDDYAALVTKGQPLETIASSTVLITFNWPRGSIRYNRTAKFVDAFFTKFANLQKPPRHPLWKTVNYAANLPGWNWFPAAQEWLDRSGRQQTVAVEAAFAEFIKQKVAKGEPSPDAEERERLFREFLETAQKKKTN